MEMLDRLVRAPMIWLGLFYSSDSGRPSVVKAEQQG
jgi:hypothetical protein